MPTSFALDRSNQPWVAFKEDLDDDAEVAHRSNGIWVIDDVDPFGNSGSYSSIVMDPLGRPWMAYQANNGLQMARTMLPTGVGDAAVPATALRLALGGAHPVRSGAGATLRLESPAAASVRVESFDLSGRRLAPARSWNVGAGVTELPWTVPAARGLCLVRATGGGKTASTRVMVVP